VAPVARELGKRYGVLEPLQTGFSVAEQVEELAASLKANGACPMTLIGYSWGAWLGTLLTAHHPDLVHALILVSSAPFTDHFAASILPTRLERLPLAARQETLALLAQGHLDNTSFKRLGALLSQSDIYDLDEAEENETPVNFQADIFAKVWPEAAALRQSGELLRRAGTLRCPLRAIHGSYDPHPIAGVRDPLSQCVKDFFCIELAHCGHTPWRERQAKDAFYRELHMLLQQI